jgi:signal transduction histidine kinase
MSDTAAPAAPEVGDVPGLNRRRKVARLRSSPRALWRGLVLGLAALARALLVALLLVALLLWVGLGLFPVFMLMIRPVRAAANTARALAGRWCGVPVAVPYRPRPQLERTEHGWYWTGSDYHKRRWFASVSLRLDWLLTDPATWRDLAWLVLDPVVGGVMAVLPAALAVGGLTGCGFAGSGIVGSGPAAWPGGGQPWTPIVVGVLGVAAVLAGWALAEPLLRLHGRWSALLLRPVRRDALADRVQQLTRTRADAVAAQAAELRRIERDLHDGAQARLVAMRMRLAMLEPLIERDPTQARRVVAELRDSSARALQELRDLVHGVHPPVLAERGLRDAVRAFALDLPLDATVDIDLPGRLEPAVEAAVYFGVCETLTNVVKHARTRGVIVRLRHADGVLRGVVVDEGRGGADPARGSGLRGIERRFAAFDGTVKVVSRPGGPTRVSLELPCALCSPRTSTCSETA